MPDAPMLSHADALLLLEIASASLTCRNEEQFRALFPRLKGMVGSDWAMCSCADLTSLGSGEELAQCSLSFDYPETYVKEYLAEALHLEDRVVGAFLQSGTPQGFSELAAQSGGSGPDRVRRLDLEHGMRQGYLCGTFGDGSPYGCLFFLSGPDVEERPRTRRVLELAAPHLAEALKRVTGAQVSRLRHGLTPREVEVLRWLKEGKSSWEISVILSLSENGVNFHVKNIVRKLQAANRTHAVALALSYGLIEL